MTIQDENPMRTKYGFLGIAGMVFYILRSLYEHIVSIAFIAIGIYLLIWPPESLEAELEISKTTLLAILAIIIGMNRRPSKRKN